MLIVLKRQRETSALEVNCNKYILTFLHLLNTFLARHNTFPTWLWVNQHLHADVSWPRQGYIMNDSCRTQYAATDVSALGVAAISVPPLERQGRRFADSSKAQVPIVPSAVSKQIHSLETPQVRVWKGTQVHLHVLSQAGLLQDRDLAPYEDTSWTILYRASTE